MNWQQQYRMLMAQEYHVPQELTNHSQLLNITDPLHDRPTYQIVGTNICLLVDMAYVVEKPELGFVRFQFGEKYGKKLLGTNDLAQALLFIAVCNKEVEPIPTRFDMLCLNAILFVSKLLALITVPKRKEWSNVSKQ